MKKIKLGIMLVLGFSVVALKAQNVLDKEQKQVIAGLEKKQDEYGTVSKKIWDLAEVGYQEYKSSALLKEELKKKDFRSKKMLLVFQLLLWRLMGKENLLSAFWLNMMHFQVWRRRRLPRER